VSVCLSFILSISFLKLHILHGASTRRCTLVTTTSSIHEKLLKTIPHRHALRGIYMNYIKTNSTCTIRSFNERGDSLSFAVLCSLFHLARTKRASSAVASFSLQVEGRADLGCGCPRRRDLAKLTPRLVAVDVNVRGSFSPLRCSPRRQPSKAVMISTAIGYSGMSGWTAGKT